MNKGICLICSAVNSRMVDILNTYLMEIYEKLTDLKVHQESHYLCFICHRRLQQCYQLQQLAVKAKHKNLYTLNTDEPHNPMITLSFSKLLNVMIPCESEHLVKRKSINVKQEVDDEEVTCVLELETQQERLECIQKQKIKIENETKYTYVCDICQYVTYSESKLNKHYLIVHNKTVYKRLLKNKDSNYVNKTKWVICDICNKVLNSIPSLILHMRTHTGEKPYQCNICNKTFSLTSSLRIHKRTHTGIRPYACDVCNKRFTQYGNLIRHKRIHTGDKPFGCDLCNKSFSEKSGLKQHKRIHTGEKPFVCDICNRPFSKNSSLTKHKRIHTKKKIK